MFRRVFLFLYLMCTAFYAHAVFADEGDLSGDEMEEIFDDVNHGADPASAPASVSGDLEDSPRVAAVPKNDFDDLPEGFERLEVVDDDNEAANEINNAVGDSLTESNSFQSYRPEPEVTAEQFINAGGGNDSTDPGSYTYQPREKKKKHLAKKKAIKKKSVKKKTMAKKAKKSKKVAKAKKPSKAKHKSRKVASSKKHKQKRAR